LTNYLEGGAEEKSKAILDLALGNGGNHSVKNENEADDLSVKKNSRGWLARFFP
jgi:hypothetical protein